MDYTIHSKRLRHALDHGSADVDTALRELVITLIGPYENAQSANGWTERNMIYARNGQRKAILNRMDKWLASEIGDIYYEQ